MRRRRVHLRSGEQASWQSRSERRVLLPSHAAAPHARQRLHGVPYIRLCKTFARLGFAAGFCAKDWCITPPTPAFNAFVNASYREAEHIHRYQRRRKSVLVERGVPEAKLTVIYNWADSTGDGPLTVPSHMPASPCGSCTRVMSAHRAGSGQRGCEHWPMLPQTEFRFTVIGGGAELVC